MDAMFISPHKFIGGPGSSGILIAKKAHLILPTHRLIDATSEAAKGKKKTQISLQDENPRKLTVHLQPERVVAVGVTEQGQFNGLAYICDRQSGLQIEGEIRMNLLDGEGIKRQI